MRSGRSSGWCVVGRRFVKADADHLGNAVRRGEKDLDFLATLRTCETIGAREQVFNILRELLILNGPEWRIVAAERTLERIGVAVERRGDPPTSS